MALRDKLASGCVMDGVRRRDAHEGDPAGLPAPRRPSLAPAGALMGAWGRPGSGCGGREWPREAVRTYPRPVCGEELLLHGRALVVTRRSVECCVCGGGGGIVRAGVRRCVAAAAEDELFRKR